MMPVAEVAEVAEVAGGVGSLWLVMAITGTHVWSSGNSCVGDNNNVGATLIL